MRLMLLASTALLAACTTAQPDPMLVPPVASETATEAATVTTPPVDQAAALKTFFENYDQAELALSPMSKSYRGIKDGDYGKLNDFSDAAAIIGHDLDQRTVEEMTRRFDRPSLSAEDQLSYDLLKYRNQRSDSVFPYRRYQYVFDQMNGAQADIPAFLINIHKIDNEQDARDTSVVFAPPLPISTRRSPNPGSARS